MTSKDRLLDLLRRVARKLPPPPKEILVFGSASLTLNLLPDHTSQDMDISGPSEDLVKAVEELGFGKKPDPGAFFIEVSPSAVFMAPAGWRERARRISLPKGHSAIVPDPLDILLSKLVRYSPKDQEDTSQVLAALSPKPRAEEMIERLQTMLDIYRPRFDEERPAGDPWYNTRRFFREHFGRDIDVRKEIIVPGLEKSRLLSSAMEDLPPIPPRPPSPKKKP